MNHQRGRHYLIGLLVAVPLLILIIGESRGSYLAVEARNTSTGKMSVAPAPETTDVISVALDVAQSSGLSGDPSAIYLSKGVYKDYRLPNTLESSDDNRNIWVIRLDAEFLFDGYGVTDLPVNHLYIYIDADTGLPFARSAGKLPIEQFNQQVWNRVTLNDIGKFPIPKFASNVGTEVLPLKPTATPAK